ncbi:unnamed protein product [Hydatigera taeniaeformis]|uniref:Uncharacterized protein n=1 Tax=Hydatigena taeniaeformis TaxID=6205 RepID=A0A0R3XAI5_HYDTA|nr:unnamed protein product [Hydatigera taeniaeformis]
MRTMLSLLKIRKVGLFGGTYVSDDQPISHVSGGLQEGAHPYGDSQTDTSTEKPDVASQLPGEAHLVSNSNSNAVLSSTSERQDTGAETDEHHSNNQDEDVDDTMLSRLYIVASEGFKFPASRSITRRVRQLSLCDSSEVLMSQSPIGVCCTGFREMQGWAWVLGSSNSCNLTAELRPEDFLEIYASPYVFRPEDDIDSQLRRLSELEPSTISTDTLTKDAQPSAPSISQASTTSANIESTGAAVSSYLQCSHPLACMNLMPSTGAISPPSTAPATASLLGHVPAQAAAPFIPPGATLLPAVLAYPTAYLPPNSASSQGCAPWIPIAQLLQSGGTGFIGPTPTAGPVTPVAPVFSQSSNAASTTGKTTCTATSISTTICAPSSAPVTPLLLPPSAPGFFLYPAGVNGELHALPVAPINPTVGPLFPGPPAGLLNVPLVPPPRPPLPQPQLIRSSDGNTEEGTRKTVESVTSGPSKDKTPTSSGFFPAHYDGQHPTHIGGMCIQITSGLTANPIILFYFSIIETLTRLNGIEPYPLVQIPRASKSLMLVFFSPKEKEITDCGRPPTASKSSLRSYCHRIFIWIRAFFRSALANALF